MSNELIRKIGTVDCIVAADEIVATGRLIKENGHISSEDLLKKALQYIAKRSHDEYSEYEDIVASRTDKDGFQEEAYRLAVENALPLDDVDYETKKILASAPQHLQLSQGLNAIIESCLLDDYWLPLVSYAQTTSKMRKGPFESPKQYTAKVAFWTKVANIVTLVSDGNILYQQ